LYRAAPSLEVVEEGHGLRVVDHLVLEGIGR
jgi:hypothetical protein